MFGDKKNKKIKNNKVKNRLINSWLESRCRYTGWNSRSYHLLKRRLDELIALAVHNPVFTRSTQNILKDFVF